MSQSESSEAFRRALERSELQEGLSQTGSESQEEGLRQTRSETQEDLNALDVLLEEQPAPPRKRKTSKVLLEAFGVSGVPWSTLNGVLCQVEPTTAAEVAPLNPLPDEAQGLEGEAAVATQVAPSGAVAITIASADFGLTPAASARPQGAGGVTTAHHYPKVGPRLAQGWEGVRRPLAITKEASGSTILTPRGCSHSECSPSECSHSGLRVRRLRVDCSKLCFSPIGAVLVICCFSLVICVAQIFSPPPFGINTGANGAECNATGFDPMPICICPRETVCVKDFKSLAFLALARCAAITLTLALTLTLILTCAANPS